MTHQIHWDVLDTHMNDDAMNDYGIAVNFNRNTSFFRFFTIQQKGVGFTGFYGFGIRQIEIFGVLFEIDYPPHFICNMITFAIANPFYKIFRDCIIMNLILVTNHK